MRAVILSVQAEADDPFIDEPGVLPSADVRGVFRSVDDLEKAIARYIAATNKSPKPFVWTATANAIRTKLALDHPSESVH